MSLGNSNGHFIPVVLFLALGTFSSCKFLPYLNNLISSWLMQVLEFYLQLLGFLEARAEFLLPNTVFLFQSLDPFALRSHNLVVSLLLCG